AANSSDTLHIAFGNPADRYVGTSGFANFSLQLVAFPVSPVPLPAGGLLLLGALGGVAALRRRKSV
ncbi:MAG: VPLPA-CTERM sorting domain-containing protein, partial [Paracoccaceae bacterium]